MTRVLFPCALLLLPAVALVREVSFSRDLRPILSNRCFKCHGPHLKKPGLDLQSRDSAFDAPSREVTCERRPRSNTPLQVLATLNDRAFVQPAAALARRMMVAEINNREHVIAGIRICVARSPREPETELLLKLHRDSLEKYRKSPVAASDLASSGLDLPPDLDPAELAAWTVVANVLPNLDETITRN